MTHLDSIIFLNTFFDGLRVGLASSVNVLKVPVSIGPEAGDEVVAPPSATVDIVCWQRA